VCALVGFFTGPNPSASGDGGRLHGGADQKLACYPAGSTIGPRRVVFRVLVDGAVNGSRIALAVARPCEPEPIHSRLYERPSRRDRHRRLQRAGRHLNLQPAQHEITL
jgi:hypothetical protein